MKRIILTVTLLSVICLTYGQVKTKFYPNKDALEQVETIRNHPTASKIRTFPSFDVQKLINEDKLNEDLDIPFRFGKGFDTNITLKDGEWIDVEGGRLWSLEFQSKGAYSINFVFNKLYLSDNAELYISNMSGTVLYGPVTSKENTKSGFFLTDLVQGDDVIMYLFEPNNVIDKSMLTIEKVVHAYKDLYPMSYGNLGGSGSCNNDIACFSAWDEESDAVALVLLSNGTELCSGSLVMSASQTFEPYFLSAFHCIDTSRDGSLSSTEISNAENWMFKFQYKMTSCGGSNATTGVTFNGAEYRAAWNTSDFALMEMDNSPLGNTSFSWLGWDRSGTSPASGTGIHHPSGDVMKISFDNDAVSETSEGSTSGGTSHWFVDIDDGTLENGSSGSPLFNEDRRVVGQLHSGYPGCSSSQQFWYGCFHESWTGGGTNTTRLSNWLDPCGSAAISTNTSRSPVVSGSSLVCTSGSSISVDNLPLGATIIWDQSANLSRGSSQGSNPCAFSANGQGEGWIEATIITACENIILPRKEVWVGLKASFSGPSSIFYQGSGTYTASTTCGTSPYTYQWWLEEVNSGIYATVVGYGNPLVLTSVPRSTKAFDNDEALLVPVTRQPSQKTYYDLYLRVSDANNNVYTTSKKRIVAYGDVDLVSMMMKSSVEETSQTYILVFPNPSSSETTISIESTNLDIEGLTANDWDLEIYNQNQQLKTKKTKIKDKSCKINTQGWREGVYFLKAMLNDEIITGKLVVKK